MAWCFHIRGVFLTLTLAAAALSSLHPECEFIFQLQREEQNCLQYIKEQGNRSIEGCRPFWDAVLCWPHAVVGETVHRACPAVFSLFKNSTGSVSRNCTPDGWSRPFLPHHIACSVDADIPETEQSYFATVKLIYTIGYSISLTVLTVAVLVLLLFRRLRCARNFIHIQLFTTFILKAVAVFIKDATLFSSDDTNHCTLSTFACKASVVFCHYCVMANFFWLLVEALYLNSLLLSSFYHSRRCLWGFSLLGWGEKYWHATSLTVFVLRYTVWFQYKIYHINNSMWQFLGIVGLITSF
ncbi:growth hormone releasing hormone receptor%2C like [Xyrichtys novacula]|uniref:Growth hormone-releasing hormone receptor n=1 Tax=Xyrichtys novacula TaxID=13765 RepID=A0AAV1FIT7_XYRNO|nr:growth hormone releasing hormone receptor%2C like [Xyrichtys novacula]